MADVAAEAPKIDSFDLVDPVNVLTKVNSMPTSFYDMVASSQWKERKEALESLVGILDVPKIQNGDFYMIVAALQKVIQSDANVFCVELAAKSVGFLARGLRKEFAVHARSILPIMLEKFKEKKQNVVNALLEALEHMYPHSFSLLEIIDDPILKTLQNKVPTVRQHTLAVLLKYLAATPKPVLTKILKPLTVAIIGVCFLVITLLFVSLIVVLLAV